MRVPVWLRALIPAVLILVWLGAASVGGPYFGRISEVSSNDQASYLPSSADATKVQAAFPDFNGSDSVPAVVVVVGDAALQPTDIATVQGWVAGIQGLGVVQGSVSPPIPSEDGRAVEVFVPLTSAGELSKVVAEIRAYLADHPAAGLTTYVTGPAGFAADLGLAFTGIDGILLLVALAAVFVILLLVYRSPLLPLLVLGTSVFALTVSLLTVWWLAKAGVFTLNGQVQGILFILVIGAATDYSLLYVSRYRDALRHTQRRWDATWIALRRALAPILASGGTVIAGLLCLLFSDLTSNKALGPVAAVGISFSVLAALTLLPSLLLACGRVAFWPLRPKYDPTLDESETVSDRGLWAAVGRLIARRSRAIWIVCTAVLLLACVGVTQLQANGVAQSDLILGHSEARDGQGALGEHFPAGSGSPAYILGSGEDYRDLVAVSRAVPGVQSVLVTSVSGVGAPIMTPEADHLSSYEPKVVDERVLLQATLSDAADSDAAKATVERLRSAVRGVDPGALVGGVTAIAIDSDAAGEHDRNTIIPIVLLVILVILMLLLRAIVAPLLLIGTVVISFGAAMGVSALVFNGIFRFPGADPSVPLFGFVFLVALGIDYNIFLMTRVREESIAHGTRPGILRGVQATGSVITSAGVVLAATFAALSVIPVLFLAQIAFIVAFGVLLDTIVVRSLLVPALSYDIGPAIWWPSKLARVASPRVSHATRNSSDRTTMISQ